MTNLNGILDPIGPVDDIVGDDMPLGDMEGVQVQEEIIGNEAFEMLRQARRPKRKWGDRDLRPDHIPRR